MRVDIPLNLNNQRLIEQATQIATDYIDLRIENGVGLITLETKGFVFAGFLELNSNTADYQVRLSTQILRQVRLGVQTMRIEDSEHTNECIVSFFWENLNKRPLLVRTKKSNLNYTYYDTILRDVIEDELFLANEDEIITSIRVIKKISKSIRGLGFKDVMVLNGRLFIDMPTYKIFSVLPVVNNLYIPSYILNSNKWDVSNAARMYVVNGYYMLRAENYIIGWRKTKVDDGGMWDAYAQMQPYSTGVCTLMSLSTFLEDIKIADNRDQFCVVDFANGTVEVRESSLITYSIPIDVEVYGDTTDLKCSLNLKDLRNVLKCIGDTAVTFKVYQSFVELDLKLGLGESGVTDVQYILQKLSIEG